MDVLRQALFVRAGATGDGTLNNPTGDIEALLGTASAGDIIFILFDNVNGQVLNDPANGLSNFVNIPDGVQITGEAAGLTIGGTEIVPPGQRPDVRMRFVAAGNNSLVGFESVIDVLTVQGDGQVQLRTCDVPTP